MTTTRLARAAAALLAVAGLALSATGCTPPLDTYVAIGDSFVSGALVPGDLGQPYRCLRSSNNYPGIVSRSGIGTTRFVDNSCSGAKTADIFNPKDLDGGEVNPPQITGIDSRTRVVTLSMGGNDIGFSSIVTDCLELNPFGTPCRDQFVTPAGDELRQRIVALRPKLEPAVQEIRRRAPRAKVFVVGYPTIFPDSGSGCWPKFPVLPVDVAYLRGIHKELNAQLRAIAVANGATYVDMYTPSIGHDACSSSRWVEGLLPSSSGLSPVHPNAAGHRGMANVLAPIVKAALAS